MRGHREQCHLQARETALTRNQRQTPVWDFQPPEPAEDTSLPWKAHSLCYSVVAAQADHCRVQAPGDPLGTPLHEDCSHLQGSLMGSAVAMNVPCMCQTRIRREMLTIPETPTTS